MSKNSFKHHAVIGDGFSAAKFAEHLPLIAAEQLTIVGADISNLGRGLAYRHYPAVTEVGDVVLPFPLHDVVNLSELIIQANQMILSE